MKRLTLLSLLATLIGMLALMPMQAEAQSQILKNIPVTGTTANGGPFDGVVTITEVVLEGGELLASGILRGTADGTRIRETFTNAPLDLINGGAPDVCDILFLDLGPIDLDLLGLVVNLSQVTLNVDAVPGPGNLLGNLLCAVAGLLD